MVEAHGPLIMLTVGDESARDNKLLVFGNRLRPCPKRSEFQRDYRARLSKDVVHWWRTMRGAKPGAESQPSHRVVSTAATDGLTVDYIIQIPSAVPNLRTLSLLASVGMFTELPPG